jgi:proteasome lid subunit RPN8/RPN11
VVFGVRPIVRVDDSMLDAMRAAAVEAHPYEALGCLVGEYHDNVWTVFTATVDQFVELRSSDAVIRSMPTSERLEEMFHDRILGDWHSHPDATAYISRCEDGDLECMEIDDIEIVVSVWPGPRKWRTKVRAYVKISTGRVLRATIES